MIKCEVIFRFELKVCIFLRVLVRTGVCESQVTNGVLARHTCPLIHRATQKSYPQFLNGQLEQTLGFYETFILVS